MELLTFQKLANLTEEEIRQICNRGPTVKFLEDYILRPEETGKLVGLTKQNGSIAVGIIPLKSGGSHGKKDSTPERTIIIGPRTVLQVL